MKIFLKLLLELYWVFIFSVLTYLSLKFIMWFHSFNIIIFYLLTLFFLYYDFKTYQTNQILLRTSYALFIKNRGINFKLIWLIFRSIIIAILVIYYLMNPYSEYVVFYNGLKIIGLFSFFGFIFVNYFRLSIMNISDLSNDND